MEDITETESSRQLNQATLRHHQIAKERATIKTKSQISQNEGNEQLKNKWQCYNLSMHFVLEVVIKLDPLGQYERPEVPELRPEFHGLTEEDLDTI